MIRVKPRFLQSQPIALPLTRPTVYGNWWKGLTLVRTRVFMTVSWGCIIGLHPRWQLILFLSTIGAYLLYLCIESEWVFVYFAQSQIWIGPQVFKLWASTKCWANDTQYHLTQQWNICMYQSHWIAFMSHMTCRQESVSLGCITSQYRSWPEGTAPLGCWPHSDFAAWTSDWDHTGSTVCIQVPSRNKQLYSQSPDNQLPLLIPCNHNKSKAKCMRVENFVVLPRCLAFALPTLPRQQLPCIA